MIGCREMCIAVSRDTWRMLGNSKKRSNVCRSLISNALMSNDTIEDVYLDMAVQSRNDPGRQSRVRVPPEVKSALMERVRRINMGRTNGSVRTPDLIGAIICKAVAEGRVNIEHQATLPVAAETKILRSEAETQAEDTAGDSCLIRTLPEDGMLWTGENARDVVDFLRQATPGIAEILVRYVTPGSIDDAPGMNRTALSRNELIPVLQIKTNDGKMHRVLPNTAVTATRYGVPMEHCTRR